MKNTLSKIWGVVAVVVLLSSLLVTAAPPTPAAAGTLSLSAETLPGTANFVLGPAGVDINDFAMSADGQTIYAAVTGSDAIVWYVSTAIGGTLTTNGTLTVTYVDQDGNTAQAATAITLDSVTQIAAGSYGTVALTSPDTAVRDVTTVTLTGFAGSTSGVVKIMDASAMTDTFYTMTSDGAGAFTGSNGIIPKCIYKSTNGGLSWTALSTPTTPGINTKANLIAIAPDTSDYVVVVADSVEPYVSTNGGTTWSTMGTVPEFYGASSNATAVYDIDISQSSSGTRYVALAGTAGTDKPGIYYFNLGAAAPAWRNAAYAATNDFTNNIAGTTATYGSTAIDIIRAVKFSPNFASDQTLTAVSEETNAAASTAGARFHAMNINIKKWDSGAGYGSSYPKAIKNAITGTSGFSVPSARIALAPDYLGSDESMRVAFIGASITDSTVEAGGIFRLADVTLKVIQDTPGFASIDYNGTVLVAGAITTTAVYRSTDMLASSPTATASSTEKKPGGVSNTIVAIGGTNVYAATTGNESAFSVSANNGQSFNDLSMIDTRITKLEDVYVTPDGAKVFLLSDDAADLSIWRYSGSWQRVFSLQAPSALAYILRGSPDSNDVLYLAKKGDTPLYYTKDGGETKWSLRASGSKVQDLAVESTDVAYVAVYGAQTVTKTSNGGFTWASAKASNISAGNIHTIASISPNNLVVGSTSGYVAYSTDGNTSWTKIDSQLESGATNVQVTADGLASGGHIFAASDMASTKVVRWTIGSSSSWTDLKATNIIAGYKAFGIALKGSALYVLTGLGTVSGTNGQILRTLEPLQGVPDVQYWNSITSSTAHADFGVSPVGPKALVVSGTTSNKLWAIDADTAVSEETGDSSTAINDDLYSYTDTLATVQVKLVSPANAFQNKMNPVTGRSVDIAFNWTKPSSSVTNYEIGIYLDAECTNKIAGFTTAGGTVDTPVAVMGPYQSQSGNQFVEFVSGTTYYWRVRVSTPISSLWSEVRSFGVEPGVALVPSVLSPTNGVSGVSQTPSFSWSPVSGTTEYHFVLADNTNLTTPIVDVKIASTGYAVTKTLDFGKTYFWSVKATQPVEGGWSALSNFTVMAKPAVVTASPTPTFTVTVPPITLPPQPAPTTFTITTPAAPAAPAPITPAFIWAIIIIGAVLVIAVIVLIVRTRRVP